MTEWGFYGRETEIAELNRYLQNPNFLAKAVVGRRGVGKSELIRKALKVSDTGQPAIHMEMTAKHHLNLERLETACEAAGIADLPDNEDWKWWRTADNPQRKSWRRRKSPEWVFCETVKDLLAKDIIVVLDEFQHASEEEGGLNLEADFKLIIDDYRLHRRKSKGKLIVAGSHQQRMWHMLRDDRPLYMRLRGTLKVNKLPEADLMRMAAEQGWLRHPKRFLTMYSVYNGIPALWEDYHRENRGPDARNGLGLDAIEDDDEWHRAFYLTEIGRCLKGENSYRFDDSSHTDQPRIAARVLECLADRGSMKFSNMRKFLRDKGVDRVKPDMDPEEWNKMLRSTLHDLSADVGLICLQKRDSYGYITGETTAHIIDPNVMFQIRVRKAMVGTTKPDGKVDMNVVLAGMTEELNKDEGHALERLTAGWFGGMGFEASHGFRRGDIEVDAYGYRLTRSKDGTSVHREMLVASCKRNWCRLSARAASDLDGMAEIIGDHYSSFDGGLNDKIRNRPDYDEKFDTLVKYSYDMRKLAVAAVIPKEAWLPAGADDMVDIREMARRLGLDPDNRPEPETDSLDSDSDSDSPSP